MNLNPSDKSLTASQIDRKYDCAALRSRLIGSGTLNDRLTANKQRLVRAYMEALRDAPTTPASNVRVVQRVELDGKACNGITQHTIGFETYKDGVRIYADVDDGEDSDKFHTTLADLKAVLAALEGAGS